MPPVNVTRLTKSVAPTAERARSIIEVVPTGAVREPLALPEDFHGNIAQRIHNMLGSGAQVNIEGKAMTSATPYDEILEHIRNTYPRPGVTNSPYVRGKQGAWTPMTTDQLKQAFLARAALGAGVGALGGSLVGQGNTLTGAGLGALLGAATGGKVNPAAAAKATEAAAAKAAPTAAKATEAAAAKAAPAAAAPAAAQATEAAAAPVSNVMPLKKPIKSGPGSIPQTEAQWSAENYPLREHNPVLESFHQDVARAAPSAPAPKQMGLPGLASMEPEAAPVIPGRDRLARWAEEFVKTHHSLAYVEGIRIACTQMGF